MTEQREGMTELGEGKTELDKLIKAAQAVVDICDRKVIIGVLEPVASNCIETLRQAVEQAKGVEAMDAMLKALQAEHAVAHRHWCECDTDEDGNPVFDWEYFDEASCPECQPLYTTPPSIDALIAQAIEKHDEKMTVIKTVNTRKIAQPYIDELIAEIEAIETFGVSGGHGERSSQAISVWKLKPILDKYRGV